MNRIKQRVCLALAVVALLAADTAVTWRLATRTVQRAGSVPVLREADRDPLGAFRLEREQLRAREEAQLNDIIHSAESDPQTVAEAQRRLMDLMDRANSETALEGVLRGRGFEEVIVSVGDGSASVLVRGEALTQRESAVILDLVMRQTGLTGGNVKIIPVK